MQARLQASIAAKAERRAASAALTQVEAGIQYHAQQKNFDKLREVASASSIATKVNILTLQAWPFCMRKNTLESAGTNRNFIHAVGWSNTPSSELHNLTLEEGPLQLGDMTRTPLIHKT